MHTSLKSRLLYILLQPYKCTRDNCNYASTSLGLLKKHVSRHNAGTLRVDTDDPELSGHPPLDVYERNISLGEARTCNTATRGRGPRKRRLPKYASLSRETKVALAKEEDGMDDIVIKAEQHEPGMKLPYFCDKCNHVYGRFATIKGLKTHMKFCTGS